MVTSKLRMLMNQLSTQVSGRDFQTAEDLLSGFSGTINQFLLHKDEPFMVPRNVTVGEVPDALSFNDVLSSTSTDIAVLYDSLNSLRNLFSFNFNLIALKEDSIIKSLQKVQSLVAAFKIFNSTLFDDHIIFADSFNHSDFVARGSSLLTATECVVVEPEGVAVLPFTAESVTNYPISSIAINSASNGSVGSRISTPSHNSLAALTDSNPDTWTEYELLTSTRVDSGLVLDISFFLDKEEIVNRLTVYPVFFGDQLWPKIELIGTSTDGSSFINIKNDLPISTWSLVNEADVLELSPAQSKFSGVLTFTFSPRRTKMIRLRIRQPQGMLTGEFFRYIIGLREVVVQGIKFLSEGELVSNMWATTDEINKVALLSNQVSASNNINFGELKHYISPDDGVSWFEITPIATESLPLTYENTEVNTNLDEILIQQTGTGPQKVLGFNAGEDSVITSLPVTSLRYKVRLIRRSESFTPGQTSKKEIKTKSEIAPLSVSTQTINTLSPVHQNVSIYVPSFRVGGFTDIGTSGGGTKFRSGAAEIFKLPIPIDNLRMYEDSSILGKFNAKVGLKFPAFYLTLGDRETDKWHLAPGLEWGEAKTGGAATFDGLPETSTTYEPNLFKDITSRHFRIEQDTILFGDGTFPTGSYPPGGLTINRRLFGGLTPPSGQAIKMYLTPEPLLLSDLKPHKATLVYETMKDTDDLKISRLDPIVHEYTKSYRLDSSILSIPAPTPISRTDGVLYQDVIIPDSIEVDGFTEVDYIDGNSEFIVAAVPSFSVANQVIDEKTSVLIHFNGSPGALVDVTYSTVSIIYLRSGIDFQFGDGKDISVSDDAYVTYANQETITAASPVALGLNSLPVLGVLRDQQEFRLVPGSIKVPRNTDNRATSILDQEIGFINGYKEFEDLRLTGVRLAGFFSVDYQNALIYPASGATLGSTILLDYKYTLYRASYTACRVYNYGSGAFTLSKDKKSITLKPNFLINYIPSLVKLTYGFNLLAKVEYDTLEEVGDDLKALEDYFTPILKEYVLVSQSVPRIFLPHTEVGSDLGTCDSRLPPQLTSFVVDGVVGQISAHLIGQNLHSDLVLFVDDAQIIDGVALVGATRMNFVLPLTYLSSSVITIKVVDLVCGYESTFNTKIEAP